MNSVAIIRLLGGPTKVAKLLNISVPAVSMWQNGDIPYDKLVILAATLEKQSHGLVNRKTLFPESYKLIWPELDWCILWGQSDVCFVVTSKHKTLSVWSECLVNGLEAFIKQHHLRSVQKGFFISATQNDRVLEEVGDGLEASGDGCAGARVDTCDSR